MPVKNSWPDLIKMLFFTNLARKTTQYMYGICK